jgi:hypothetical protein
MNFKERIARADQANNVIAAVARYGRRFFWSRRHDRVSRFEVDHRGRVWYYDHYTWRRIYTHRRGSWRYFTEGGTMRRLVDALQKYIMTGEKISPYHFGPWDQMLCEGDLWGYGGYCMAEVRAEVMRSGAVKLYPPGTAQIPSSYWEKEKAANE